MRRRQVRRRRRLRQLRSRRRLRHLNRSGGTAFWNRREFDRHYLITPFVINPCQPQPPVGLPSFSAMQLMDGVIVGRSMLPSHFQTHNRLAAERATKFGPNNTLHRLPLGHTNRICALAAYPAGQPRSISKEPMGSSLGHSSLASRFIFHNSDIHLPDQC